MCPASEPASVTLAEHVCTNGARVGNGSQAKQKTLHTNAWSSEANTHASLDKHEDADELL